MLAALPDGGPLRRDESVAVGKLQQRIALSLAPEARVGAPGVVMPWIDGQVIRQRCEARVQSLVEAVRAAILEMGPPGAAP
jgi:hypothetical protein